MWFNALLLAWRSITRNWLRSSLTVLGVVIGVAAVVTMVTVGNGATLAIQNQITGLGTNLLQVRAGQRFGAGSGGVSPAFQAADATALAQQAPGVQAVAVLPVTDATRGAVLVACLQGDPSCEGAILKATRTALGPLIAPKRLIWVQDWPRLPSGKTDLAALRERAGPWR